ncbi:MAG: hypothetical protein ACETVP_02085 [Candidatus Bathyarchaeia archaeon]
MVSKAKGRFFRRRDGKYLIYVSVKLAEDSMFPFKGDSVYVEISFKVGGEVLIVEELEPKPISPTNMESRG